MTGSSAGSATRPMDDQPLVSIVMVFLNGEPFMDEAVRSIFAQTYSHWELLLVDDGSTDGSSTIARGWAAEHPQRIRYLEHAGHANRGMSASRNVAIAQARGEFLAFLDADDVFLPHKLQSQVALMRRLPQVPLVYGPVQKWFSWAPQPEKPDAPQPFPFRQFDRMIEPPELVARWITKQGGNPGTCAALVRMEAAREVGLFEESFTGMYEDQVFFAKLCLRWPAYVSSDINSRYRQHPASTCMVARRGGTWDAARFRFLTWVGRYLEQQGYRGTPLWRTWRKAIWPYHHPLLNQVVEPARAMKAGGHRFLARVRRGVRKLRATRREPAAAGSRIEARAEGPGSGR